MIEKLKEKYVFFDVDGILSEYRYKDRLYSVTNWCQEVSLVSRSFGKFDFFFIS